MKRRALRVGRDNALETEISVVFIVADNTVAVFNTLQLSGWRVGDAIDVGVETDRRGQRCGGGRAALSGFVAGVVKEQLNGKISAY